MLVLLAFLIAAQAPQPRFDYSHFSGCDDLTASVANATWSEVLRIDVPLMARYRGPDGRTTPAGPVPPGTHEYDLADAKSGARASIDLFSGTGVSPCGDVRIPTVAVWKAVSGRVTVRVRALDTPSDQCPPRLWCHGREYYADVVFVDAVFNGPNGERTRLPKPLSFTILGGDAFLPPER
jgi:hypothetical protein